MFSHVNTCKQKQASKSTRGRNAVTKMTAPQTVRVQQPNIFLYIDMQVEIGEQQQDNIDASSPAVIKNVTVRYL